MGTFRRCAVTVLAIAAFGLAGCSKTITIGAVISETGAAESYGKKVKNGLELAREEINAAGGFEGKLFEIVYRDDATNPEVGRQVTRELIDDLDISLIIGAVSSTVTIAIAPICQESEVLLLSPTASAPAITDAGSYIFRNYPSDILEGTAMANFARDPLGIEHVAIFAVDNEYGTGLKEVFAREFESRFRKIVADVSFPEGSAGALGDRIAELSELKPDGIYIAAYIDDVTSLIKQIRGAGIESLILTSGAVTDIELARYDLDSIELMTESFEPWAKETSTAENPISFL